MALGKYGTETNKERGCMKGKDVVGLYKSILLKEYYKKIQNEGSPKF